MKLVLLFGSFAVGKMTVGQELAKITDLTLFHNHMTIEPVLDVFGYYHGRAVRRLREVFFEEFAATGEYGLIFTFAWAFDQQSDWDYAKHVTELFENKGADVYYVELVASQDVRLKRNKSENRLLHKPSKRDLAFAEQDLLDADQKYRLESYDGEIPFDNYIKIDNTELAPDVVAKIIKNRFNL